jgi:hypothetical protein
VASDDAAPRWALLADGPPSHLGGHRVWHLLIEWAPYRRDDGVDAVRYRLRCGPTVEGFNAPMSRARPTDGWPVCGECAGSR